MSLTGADWGSPPSEPRKQRATRKMHRKAPAPSLLADLAMALAWWPPQAGPPRLPGPQITAAETTLKPPSSPTAGTSPVWTERQNPPHTGCLPQVSAAPASAAHAALSLKTRRLSRFQDVSDHTSCCGKSDPRRGWCTNPRLGRSGGPGGVWQAGLGARGLRAGQTSVNGRVTAGRPAVPRPQTARPASPSDRDSPRVNPLPAW